MQWKKPRAHKLGLPSAFSKTAFGLRKSHRSDRKSEESLTPKATSKSLEKSLTVTVTVRAMESSESDSDEQTSEDEVDNSAFNEKLLVKIISTFEIAGDEEYTTILASEALSMLEQPEWISLGTLTGPQLSAKTEELIQAADKALSVEDGIDGDEWGPLERAKAKSLKRASDVPVNFDEILSNVRESQDEASTQIMASNLQAPYDPNSVGRLLVLTSWSGSSMSRGSLESAKAFVIAKAKAFRLVTLIPAIITKLNAYTNLKMKPGGDQVHVILGLLQMADSVGGHGSMIFISYESTASVATIEFNFSNISNSQILKY